MQSDLIRPDKAAAMVGMTSLTLSRWADKGKIRCVRAGRHRRYYRDDLLKLTISDNQETLLKEVSHEKD
jgi:excisionase family DNA binding protein